MTRSIRRRTIAAGLLGLLAVLLPITVLPASAALPEPSVSPTVTKRVWNGEVDCPTGDLCAYVLTNQAGHRFYDEFRFYHCQTYALSYWHSWGIVSAAQVVDNQTGGVTTVLYDQNGNVLQRFIPSRDKRQPVLLNKGGWDKVYSIKVC